MLMLLLLVPGLLLLMVVSTRGNTVPAITITEYEAYMDKLAQYERELADDPNINAVESDGSIDLRQHGAGYNDHTQGGKV